MRHLLLYEKQLNQLKVTNIHFTKHYFVPNISHIFICHAVKSNKEYKIKFLKLEQEGYKQSNKNKIKYKFNIKLNSIGYLQSKRIKIITEPNDVVKK